MAKITKIDAKVKIIEPERYTLELSKEEAKLIMLLTGSCIGSSESARFHSDSLWRTISSLLEKELKLNDYLPTIDLSNYGQDIKKLR